jgi:hypothetical protein
MTTNLTDDNNCIQSGLRVDIMRCSMENKNLLAKKGSIYVGTGDTQTIGGQTIYKTKALELGGSGGVLQVINGSLGYDKIQNSNFNSGVNYSNLAGGTLKKNTLINSQFEKTEPYSGLEILNQNLATDISPVNINVVGNSSSCEIMNGRSDKKRSISLKQDGQGKLSLSYTGADLVLCKHDVTISLEWRREGDSSNTITYLFFSFIDNQFGEYNMNTYSDFVSFWEAVLGIKTTEMSNTIILHPDAIYHSSAPIGWSFYLYGVRYDSGSLKMEIRYKLSTGSWATYTLPYSSEKIKIASQTYEKLISD